MENNKKTSLTKPLFYLAALSLASFKSCDTELKGKPVTDVKHNVIKDINDLDDNDSGFGDDESSEHSASEPTAPESENTENIETQEQDSQSDQSTTDETSDAEEDEIAKLRRLPGGVSRSKLTANLKRATAAVDANLQVFREDSLAWRTWTDIKLVQRAIKNLGDKFLGKNFKLVRNAQDARKSYVYSINNACANFTYFTYNSQPMDFKCILNDKLDTFKAQIGGEFNIDQRKTAAMNLVDSVNAFIDKEMNNGEAIYNTAFNDHINNDPTYKQLLAAETAACRKLGKQAPASRTP